MSYVSEPKGKTKWSFNPRGTLWSTDENKLGQRMLQNMGWSKGKGLGKNEDGDPNCIKVSVKSDKKGMGFQGGYDDTWLEHQEGFDELLKNLNGVQELEGNEVHIKDLEKNSSKTKTRIQYRKYIRGKNLSTKSSQDLQCLFGKKKQKEKKIDGANTVNSGSMTEYFRGKLTSRKKIVDSTTAKIMCQETSYDLECNMLSPNSAKCEEGEKVHTDLTQVPFNHCEVGKKRKKNKSKQPMADEEITFKGRLKPSETENSFGKKKRKLNYTDVCL